MNSALTSSKSDNWPTPQWLFDGLNEFFRFKLDPAASEDNTKCTKFFTVSEDGLKQNWKGTVWLNPPYGKQIGKWMAKALRESKRGATVVCLVPARVDARWWHDYVEGKAEIHFLRGRVSFGDAKSNAPFPSAVVIYWPDGECSPSRSLRLK